MTLDAGRIHCQRCLTGNSLGQELCARCGTRLMIVVEPSALRYEETMTSDISEHDAHVLERVSALESRLARMTEKMEQSFDLLLQHVSTSHSSHTLLQTLVGVLSESETIDRASLEDRWRRRRAQDDESSAPGGRRAGMRARVLASDRGRQPEEFVKLVEDGFKLFAGGETTRGVRSLERAAAAAPGNAALHYFLGEHFFGIGKPGAARGYLERAGNSAVADPRLLLLLGIACGDDGEPARAASLLREAVRRGGHSFAAHYGLGRLHAAEGDWKKALSEFRLALRARPSAEAHCVVGFTFHHLGQPDRALRHLRKAVRLDSSYAEAFYLIGVVSIGAGDRRRAAEAFGAACDINRQNKRYRAALRRTEEHKAGRGRVQPPPLFGSPARRKRSLISGGDRRLTSALQEDALKAQAAR